MDTRTIHQWLGLLTASVCVRGYSYISVAESYGVNCDNGQDYQPDPDCGKFWRCANGKPFRFTCPAGLHFNVHISVCDWPENADCSGSRGGGSSHYGGSNSDYNSYGEDYDHGDQNTEDITYPYQPGTMAPRYDEKKYYTEAPRATMAPVYRPVPESKPKPRPVYRPVNNYHSGHGSNYAKGSSSQNYGSGSSSNKNYGSGSSGKNYESGSSGKNYESGSSSKSYGSGSSSKNYGSGSQSYGQGQSKKAKSSWGSSSNKNYQGGGHGSGSGGYDGGSTHSGGHHGLDYDTGRDYATGQDYYSEYEYESGQDYDSGHDYHGSHGYGSDHGGYKSGGNSKSGGGGGSGYKNGGSGKYNNQYQNKKPFFGPTWKGGFPAGINYGYGGSYGGNFGNFGFPVLPPWNYPPSFNKQPLPWLAQHQTAPQFAAGFGGQSAESGPVGGIPIYPADKQPLGSQTIGGKPVGGFPVYPVDEQPLGSQSNGGKPVGGIPVYPVNKQPLGFQTIGGKPVGDFSIYPVDEQPMGSQSNGGKPVGGIPVYPVGKQPLGFQTIGGKPVGDFSIYPVNEQPLGSQSIGGKPVGGIPVYPVNKQPLGSQIIGGKPIIIEQPVGHNSNFQPVMSDGIQPFPVGVHDGIYPEDLIIGGSNGGTQVKQAKWVGGIPVRSIEGGGTQVNPIILGKPNVGVSNLGKAFIPIIQKNPQLSHLVGNGGYLQFNPQSQSAVMNDYGLSPLVFGTGLGTGIMDESIPMHSGLSMVNAGGAGVMLQPIILGTGSGLSKILLPVKFVTSAASTTPVTTSATTTTTTTTPAPAVPPVNVTINILLPPTLPLPPPTVEEIPLPRGLSGRALPSASSAWPGALLGNPQDLSGYGFGQFTADPSRRCTARRSTQRFTMPLIQQSGNALTDRKCSALGQLINSFVLVYVENLAGQPDGSCVVQVPEIQVTCNTGARANVPG